MKKYDSTIARVAGNIASGLVRVRDDEDEPHADEVIVERSVSLARAIVAEVERTERAPEDRSPEQ